MTTQYALSLAKIMEEERDGANGFELPDCLSELIDNGFDEGSQSVHIASIQLSSGEYAMLVWDEGAGLQDLMCLYSCGKKIVKKSEGKRGLKNRGHRGTMGALCGRSVVRYASLCSGTTDPSTLMVDYKGLYTANDRAKKSPQRDLNVVDPHDFFRNSPGDGLTTKMRAFLQDCVGSSTHNEVKEFLTRVLENTLPHYFLAAVCYPTMPDGHEEAIHEAYIHFRRTYAKALEAGKEIVFHAIHPESSCHLKKEDAIPFLGMMQPIGGDLCFYLPSASFDEDNNIIDPDTGVVVSFTLGDQTMWLPNTRWATYDGRIADGAKKRSPTMTNMRKVATMKWQLAVLSQEEELEQKKLLGGESDKVEKERGVSLVYVDRNLGSPIYNDKWEARRNAGGVRCEVLCDTQVGAETFWRIQTQKNTMSFEVLHPAMKAFLNLVVGRNILKKWSFCNILQGKSIDTWDVEELCSMLENPKAIRPSMIQVAPIPSPSPSPSPSPAAPILAAMSAVIPSPIQPALSAVIPSQQATPTPTPTPTPPYSDPTTSMVSAHPRMTSKSERDVYMELTELTAVLMALDPEILIPSACTKACSDMTDLYRAIHKVKSFLQEHME